MNTATPRTASFTPGRTLAWLLLLAAGMLSLPLVATFLDDRGSENWILPVHVGGMAVVGALLGLAVPGFVPGTRPRRLLLGAAAGVATALLAVVVFFLLVSGIDGA